jgi:hypothetical protein
METNPVLVVAWMGALVARARRAPIDPRVLERIARQLELARVLYAYRGEPN